MAGGAAKSRGGRGAVGVGRGRASVVSGRTVVAPVASASHARSSLRKSTSLNPSEGSSCGSCNHVMSSDCIGCDKCSKWFHPTPMCLGLGPSVISSIVESDGVGILFVCITCRIQGRTESSGSSGPGEKLIPGSAIFKQFHEMVSGLCQTVSALLSRVQSLESASASAIVQPEIASPVESGESMRQKIREEVREMDERAKR